MAVRNRTTKSVAKRHDLDYFKKGSPLRLWQWRLALAAVCAAALWMSVSGMRHGYRMYSAGPMSSAHAVFGQKCVACHQPMIAAAGWLPIVGASKKVTDAACLNCHAAPAHHPTMTKFTPKCASCHVEHQGAMRLAAVGDASCIQCHADLKVRSGMQTVSSGIHSFVNGHPDFQPLKNTRGTLQNAFRLKFNHAEHMEAGLTAPAGKVELQCSDCHRTPDGSSKAAWRFEGASLAASADDSFPEKFAGTSPRMTGQVMGQGGAYMASVSYQKTCRACHTLEFDSHISVEAPHADLSTVQRFVIAQITNYAAAHPEVVSSEIKSWPRMNDIAGQMPWPAPHNQQEWIAARVAHADRILWRGKCSLCHEVTGGDVPADVSRGFLQKTLLETTPPVPGSGAKETELPVVAETRQPQRWFSQAVFRHDAHQEVRCESCHAAALSSTSGKDILLPNIVVCQRCHDGSTSPQGPPVATGHAESGCFLCHQYHDLAQASIATKGLSRSAFTLDDLTSAK